MQKEVLVETFYNLDAVRRGNFVLSSGRTSSFYIDCRRVALDPVGLRYACQGMSELLDGVVFDSLGTMEGVGSSAILGALLLSYGLGPMPHATGFTIRKRAKEHGTRSLIEGRVGSSPVLIDDVATSGGSLRHAIRNMPVRPVCAVVLLDRQEGAAEFLAEDGVKLLSVLKLTDLER